MVVNNVNGVMAIRKGFWKYVEGIAAAPLTEGASKAMSSELEPQLYNLETDLSETMNLIKDHPEIHKDLQQKLNQIRELGSERVSSGAEY